MESKKGDNFVLSSKQTLGRASIITTGTPPCVYYKDVLRYPPSITITSSTISLLPLLSVSAQHTQLRPSLPTQNDNASNTDLPWQNELSNLSTHLALDLVALSIRTQLPVVLIKRQYLRHKRRSRLQNMMTTKSKQLYPLRELPMMSFPSRSSLVVRHESCLTGHVHGLPNYSSTCFFNAVIQALASATCFIRYLEQLVSMQEYMPCHDNHVETQLIPRQIGGFFGSKKEPMSKLLLDILMYVNVQEGCIDKQMIHGKIRSILDRVSSECEQFRSYKFHSSKEQHDAQEFLQALITIIVKESRMEEILQEECRNQDVPQSVKSVASQKDEILLRSHDDYSMYHQGRTLDTLEKEEKKQDADDGLNISQERDGSRETKHIPTSCNLLPHSVQMMIENLSPETPSPLSGRVGSRLKCCVCQHVKPIQDSLFLEIPIVPTFVSNPLRTDSTIPCTLEECLQEFAKTEIVHGVYCHACPIQRECDRLREDIAMLTEAVTSLEDRGKDSSDTSILTHELLDLKQRLDLLQNRNPDHEDEDRSEESDGLHQGNQVDTMISIPKAIKVDHEKTLRVTRLPSILCLHVKRLHYNELSKMVKCSQHISFSEYLDVRMLYWDSHEHPIPDGRPEQERDATSPIPYRLISVIEHRGNAFSGHYITYRRAADHGVLPGSVSGSSWVYTSDETISHVSWNTVKQCDAYMLIYEAV